MNLVGTICEAKAVPSVPVGWTAGKWGEWYPDVLNEDGVLDERPKRWSPLIVDP